MEKMRWESGSSTMGLVVILLMIAVGVLGLVYFLDQINVYYTPIMNGSVDPSGIGSSGMYNNTFNLTAILVGVGGNFILLFFIIVFALILLGIAYTAISR
jgi:hypothetical protein